MEIHRQLPGIRLPCGGKYFSALPATGMKDAFTANLQGVEHRAVSRVIVVAITVARTRYKLQYAGRFSDADVDDAVSGVADVVRAIMDTYRANLPKGHRASTVRRLIEDWESIRVRLSSVMRCSNVKSVRKWFKVVSDLRGTLSERAGDITELSASEWENSHSLTQKRLANRARVVKVCALARGGLSSCVACLLALPSSLLCAC